MDSIFKPGQRVTQKNDNHKKLYLVPDREYWKRERPKWLHLSFYQKMTEDEFVEHKLRDAIEAGCFDCFEESELCHQYVLVCLDDQGNELEPGQIDTHVCEKHLKLAKKKYR